MPSGSVPQLDILTLFAVLALAQLGNVVFSLVLWMSRRRFPGAGIWVIGQLAIVAGTTGSLLLRGWLPPAIGIILSNGLLFCGALCMLESIWQFRHGRHFPWPIWLTLPLFLLVLALLLGASMNARIVAYSFFAGLATLAIGIVLVHKCEPEIRLGAWLTSLAFLVMVPVHVLRAGLAIVDPPYAGIGAQGELATWLYLVTILSAYLLLFGYFLMTSLRYEAELRRLNETNLFMMSVISHDLRAPIRSAARYVDRHLLPASVDISKKRDSLRILGQSMNNAAVLLDHLLAWSQERQHPDTPGACQELPLDEVLKPAIDLVADVLREKDIRLDQDSAGVTILADRRLAASVFRNVLSNAVRYTPEGGTISIRVETENGMSAVTVTDSGPGINALVLERLQAGGEVPRLFGNSEDVGNSLGISLCQRFMLRQGGRLEIASKPGQGSSFTMYFRAA